MSKQDKKSETETENGIVLYIKKYKNATYPTKYGIEFECVELIRRFFSIQRGLTFPDVVDASDLFKRIGMFTPLHPSASSSSVKLETYAYPYTRHASFYLRPGSILFWKYRKPDYPYGHVALIWKNDPATHETLVVQQNLNPPIKRYPTQVLFAKMNNSMSKFAGVKLLPREYLKGIEHMDCTIHRL